MEEEHKQHIESLNKQHQKQLRILRDALELEKRSKLSLNEKCEVLESEKLSLSRELKKIDLQLAHIKESGLYFSDQQLSFGRVRFV